MAFRGRLPRTEQDVKLEVMGVLDKKNLTES